MFLNKFFYAALFLTLVDCSSNSKTKEQYTYQILNTLIDHWGASLEAPFIEAIEEKRSQKNDINSIVYEKPTIGIFPILEKEILDIPLDSTIDSTYVKLMEEFNTIKKDKSLNIEKLNSENGYVLKYLDTTLTKQEEFNTYKWQFFFSNVAFNDNVDKAVITLSIKHAAHYLCFLERRDSNWIVTHSRMLHIY